MHRKHIGKTLVVHNHKEKMNPQLLVIVPSLVDIVILCTTM